MGRQIAIAMAAEDEAAFLAFLRSSADIRFYGSFAPQAEQLWTDEPPPATTGHFFYGIWNKNFPWQPKYGTVGPRAHDPSQIGWYYVADTSSAPVLDWSRCNLERRMFGRLYWSKPALASYDIVEFEKWVNSVWSWVRKNARKLEPGDSMSPYFFPHAERIVSS
jgi:hypothetical protein